MNRTYESINKSIVVKHSDSMIHLHGRDTTPRTVATLVRPERVERGRPATPATAESVSDEDDAVTTQLLWIRTAESAPVDRWFIRLFIGFQHVSPIQGDAGFPPQYEPTMVTNQLLSG